MPQFQHQLTQHQCNFTITIFFLLAFVIVLIVTVVAYIDKKDIQLVVVVVVVMMVGILVRRYFVQGRIQVVGFKRFEEVRREGAVSNSFNSMSQY